MNDFIKKLVGASFLLIIVFWMGFQSQWYFISPELTVNANPAGGYASTVQCSDRPYKAVGEGTGADNGSQGVALKAAIDSATDVANDNCSTTVVSCSPPAGCYNVGIGQHLGGKIGLLSTACNQTGMPPYWLCTAKVSVSCVQKCSTTQQPQ